MKVQVNPQQKNKLQYLLEQYGNEGEKGNYNQHRLIQWIIERGEFKPGTLSSEYAVQCAKERFPHLKFNNYRLAPELLSAIRAILQIPD